MSLCPNSVSFFFFTFLSLISLSFRLRFQSVPFRFILLSNQIAQRIFLPFFNSNSYFTSDFYRNHSGNVPPPPTLSLSLRLSFSLSSHRCLYLKHYSSPYRTIQMIFKSFLRFTRQCISTWFLYIQTFSLYKHSCLLISVLFNPKHNDKCHLRQLLKVFVYNKFKLNISSAVNKK